MVDQIEQKAPSAREPGIAHDLLALVHEGYSPFPQARVKGMEPLRDVIVVTVVRVEDLFDAGGRRYLHPIERALLQTIGEEDFLLDHEPRDLAGISGLG